MASSKLSPQRQVHADLGPGTVEWGSVEATLALGTKGRHQMTIVIHLIIILPLSGTEKGLGTHGVMR